MGLLKRRDVCQDSCGMAKKTVWLKVPLSSLKRNKESVLRLRVSGVWCSLLSGWGSVLFPPLHLSRRDEMTGLQCMAPYPGVYA